MEPITSIGISEFGRKYFIGGGRSKPMIAQTPETFLGFVNAELASTDGGTCRIVAAKGMPFCKYLFIANFTDAKVSHMRIDNSNAQWLRSGYEARRDSELPVLTRWFDLPCPVKQADLLMIILYSREQLLKEATKEDWEFLPKEDWSVISVIPLDEFIVPPMPPITMFRNALGVEEGGNGVPLDKADYIAAVEYWNDHASVI